jgi:hypothetical protein
MNRRDEVEVCVDLERFGEPAGLARKDAARIVEEIREAVGTWREEASALGLSRWEQTEMAAAFED